MIKNILTILFSFQVINISFAQNNHIENNTNTNEKLYELLTSNNAGQDLYYYLNQPPNYIFPDEIKYWGDLKNGIPHGLGFIYKKDKVFYSGEFEKGKCEGSGIKISPIDICIGSFNQNKFDGYGISYLLKDTTNFQKNVSLYFEKKINSIIEIGYKVKFTGFLASDDDILKSINPSLYSFKGSMITLMDPDSIFSKKIIMTGNYNNNKYIGNGTIELEYLNPRHTVLKEIYYGNLNFMYGKPDSIIYYGFPTTGYYVKAEGVFSDMHDFKGTLSSADKNSYEGEFKNLSLVGIGKMHNDEFEYEGEFSKLKMHGKGKVIFKEGSIYKSGSYLDGVFENNNFSSGVFYNSETNEYIKANFINGNPEGEAIVTVNGKSTKVIYKNGERKN